MAPQRSGTSSIVMHVEYGLSVYSPKGGHYTKPVDA